MPCQKYNVIEMFVYVYLATEVKQFQPLTLSDGKTYQISGNAAL